MNKLKTLLIILLTLCFVFPNSSKEEEIKTVERDGITYKINPQSGNQTPLNASLNEGTVNNNNQSEEKYELHFNLGHISPIGENLRNSYNPGYSFGFSIKSPQSINFFNKNWALYGILNFSKLPANNIDTDRTSLSMLNMGSTLSTNFGPVILNAGLSLTPFMSSYHDMNDDIEKNDNEIFISLIGSVGYQLTKNKKFDIILNLHFQEIFGSTKQADTNRGTSEIYGLNLLIGKGLDF